MLIADTADAPRGRAPLPNGPTAAALIPPGTSERVAVVQMEIPAGGGLPEHSHGPSEIVLIPLSGTLRLEHEGQARTLESGAAAHIATGERVSLNNPGTEPATLMLVASPPEFAIHLTEWPAV
jgi:quercetin dioxygenase-like cupin family protein